MTPAGLYRFLGSLRLTLSLLLSLAGAAALGTFLQRGEEGPVYFRSLPFRGLMVLLSLNMAVCLWSRRAVFTGAFRKGAVSVRPLYSLVAHLCLLFTMFFSLAGSLLGFVGTQNVHVGSSLTSVFDWGAKADRTLPFALRILGLRRENYPIAVKVGVRVKKTGERREMITTHLGGEFVVKNIPGSFFLQEVHPEEKIWLIVWRRQALGETIINEGDEIPGSGLELVVTAYKDFSEEKIWAADVEVVRGGEMLARQAVSPNHPLAFEGWDIFLTASGEDESGKPFVGFQVVSDPFSAWTMGFGTAFFLASTGALLMKTGRAGK